MKHEVRYPKEVTRIAPELVLFFTRRGTLMKKAPTHFAQIPVEVVKKIAVLQELGKTVGTGSTLRKPTSRTVEPEPSRRSHSAGPARVRYQRVRPLRPVSTDSLQPGTL